MNVGLLPYSPSDTFFFSVEPTVSGVTVGEVVAKCGELGATAAFLSSDTGGLPDFSLGGNAAIEGAGDSASDFVEGMKTWGPLVLAAVAIGVALWIYSRQSGG